MERAGVRRRMGLGVRRYSYLCPPMFKIILYGFLLYLLYKFIFELVIPVTKATSQVKDKLREMQEQQQRAARQQEQQAEPQERAQASGEKKGDYIEFEEIK
jgi:heme exporter protein D